MISLHTLQNSAQKRKPRKRVGRGIGSGTGKTCGRGHKGMGSRAGYQARHGYEGGQMRFFMKMPQRGFTNARFATNVFSVNLGQIDKSFQDGETVNEATLREHGLLNGHCDAIKVLGNGELTKKVHIEVHAISANAQEKLNKAHVPFKLIEAQKL